MKALMEKDSPEIYGILARFPDSETLVKAARAVAEDGYQRIDTYTPFPVEELSVAMRLPPSRLPLGMLAGVEAWVKRDHQAEWNRLGYGNNSVHSVAAQLT